MLLWTKCYKPDPRIALGKYSPMEKEIQRLGGVHTIAARRFLAHKQMEEKKMLTKLLSPDHEQVTEHSKQNEPLRPTFVPLKKTWTTKVAVSAQELKIPPRERTNICKHIERMQLAQVLRNGQSLPHV
ncbi:uncharacterized protein C10orf120 homolog [Rhynchocyon petersi]